MPTTLTGVLLFVILLMPGFAYLVGKERVGTERKASAFREPVAVVAASVAAELAVIVLVSPFWSRHIDFDRLMREPGRYWTGHPARLAWWAVGLLATATLVAWLATKPWVPNLPRQVAGRLPDKAARTVLPASIRHGSYPHTSAVSGWWMLFEHYKPGQPRDVEVILDDGSYIVGRLLSFNTDASDTADRDLVLCAPIDYRPPGHDDVVTLDASAACISARRITTMLVTYIDPNAEPSPDASVLEAEQDGGAETEE